MKRQQWSHLWGVLVLLSLILSACASPTPTAAPAPDQNQQPTAVPQATQAAQPTEPPAPAPTAQPQAAQPSGDKVTLTLYTNWVPDDTDKGLILLDAIKEFNAANPNAEIKEEVIPDTEMATKVETAFLENKEPDIILHNWLGLSKDWLSDGVVVPVTQYIQEWGFEGKFKPAALDNYRVGDEIAAFPLDGP